MKEILPTSSGGPSQPPSQTQTNDQNEEIAMLIYETLNPWTEPDWAPFYNTYKAMHENPGVSGDEGFAADKATAFLESVRGMHVVRDIGRNERRGVGPSVVGVFRNAADGEDVNGGKVVLLRADMDALPVREDTGLEYSSKIDGIMHACGHDLHVAALMAAVQALVEMKHRWTGTLIACFQPGEEKGVGALGMIEGGMYGEKYGIPTPNYVFGGHVSPEKARTISLTRGTAYSRSDSWKITLKGKGGHGSRPEAAIDPVVMASYAVTRLQTVVSRVVPSKEAGVLTVGEINGGTAENIIPESAYIKVNTRADSDNLAEKMEIALRNIIDCEVQASIPDLAFGPDMETDTDTNPNVHYESISHLPLLKNDPAIADPLAATFRTVFGAKNFTYPVPGVSGSEDFSILARSDRTKPVADIPYVYWRYGSTDEKRWDDAEGDVNRVPANHNSRFYPQLDIEDYADPLKVGATALCAAALKGFWDKWASR